VTATEFYLTQEKTIGKALFFIELASVSMRFDVIVDCEGIGNVTDIDEDSTGSRATNLTGEILSAIKTSGAQIKSLLCLPATFELV